MNHCLPAFYESAEEETLTVYNLSLEADGWKAVCRFTNEDGKSYSTAAVIHVQ